MVDSSSEALEQHEAGNSLLALELCYETLAVDPEHHRARLVLALICFDRGWEEFCLKELLELHRRAPESQTIERLIESVSPGTLAALKSAEDKSEDSQKEETSQPEAEESTVAEAEFDFDEIEIEEE